MVKKKSKIDDKITKGRIADASSMKNSVERMGQARLKNRAGMQPMANRARLRMPETKDEVSIPDDVETIKDLQHHIRKVLDVPDSSYFFLRAWTNQGSKRKTVVLKDAQYIIDLEDNHSGRKPLVITICWTYTSDCRKELYQVLKRRKKLEQEDKEYHSRKQARPDDIVLGKGETGKAKVACDKVRQTASKDDGRCAKKGKEFDEMGKKFGEMGKELGKELGGNTNNEFNKERSLASTQACEKCGECGRSLTCAHFWPVDWRHRTQKDRSIKCKECCPKPPKERLGGYMAGNEQRSIEAAAKTITCQVCKRDLPRTQFRPNSSRGRFDLRKPLTCEQCRAEGKHPKSGPKRQRVE